MYKKPIQTDGLHSCLGEEGADARFGTYLTHLKQDTRYNAGHVCFVSKGAAKLGFISFFVLFHRITKSFILILKICTKSFYSYMILFYQLVEFYQFSLRF